ncbi:ATP-binding protein [Laspinema palackyanum]|uniref:ATP-binding protein n=1 Tax=Laspinema palackyanum TaxID=3231601 RepID=UPI00345C8640|nr:ATP-binding protein [Laspinema sp. D2c]
MDLESHRFISYFLPDQRPELCHSATIEKFPPGTVIFEENEKPDALYLVLDGKIEFSKRGGLGQYQNVAWAEENDFFGEFGVLDGQPRSARAVTCTSATIAKIPRDRLMDILERSPGKVVLQLFHHIIHYLRLTTEQYVNQMVHKHKMMAVGEMANTIIHDLKSPFTGISLANSMLKDLHQDEETQEWCNLIQAQITQMVVMTEEILEFTRGKATLNQKTFNLGESLEKFQRLNFIYWNQHNINFILRCDNIILNGDENKLMRVWQNLVGNAVEALDEQGGQIVLIAAKLGQDALIKISDSGPGIPEAIQSRLFDPFVTYGKRGGTGLGTAIALSIVEAHGGDITFESQAGKGTTFYIRLPLC